MLQAARVGQRVCALQLEHAGNRIERGIGMAVLGDDQQRSTAAPSAASAPRVMALAALPTANTCTGAAGFAPAQEFLDTGPPVYRAQRGVEYFEQEAARVHEARRTGRDSSGLDDLETAALGVAARGLGRIRTLLTRAAPGIPA